MHTPHPPGVYLLFWFLYYSFRCIPYTHWVFIYSEYTFSYTPHRGVYFQYWIKYPHRGNVATHTSSQRECGISIRKWLNYIIYTLTEGNLNFNWSGSTVSESWVVLAFNRLCSLLKLGKLDINEFLGPPIQYSLDQLVGLIWRDGHYFPSSINSDHITAKTCDMVNDVGLNDLGFGTHPTGVY